MTAPAIEPAAVQVESRRIAVEIVEASDRVAAHRDLGRITAADVRAFYERNAAEAAGLDATHVTVAVGKRADLLVLRADPTLDIANTQAIALVPRQGRQVR